MSITGLIGLLVAFAAIIVSVACLLIGHICKRKEKADLGETLAFAGSVASLVGTAALTLCCGILVYCFMTGDTSIQYVVQNHSNASDGLGWLYRLSGLWGGREGSLLFWAWLISVFNAIVAIRNIKKLDELDNMALLVSQLVLAAFAGVLLFSADNMPFTAMAAQYFDENGNLTGNAAYWGMNVLLEHWAMSIHPPTLFIGYAGMTIPFAYAIAALIVNDPSRKWVERSTRYTIFSWLFLSIGIGLGAVWAYVVLGWGGYWGWDAVENASLLPWLVGLALIHSFTIYRQRDAFKRWSVMCACIAFCFVILGTFITRSGVVNSVHAFEGDSVSLILFLLLIVASLIAGIIGLIVRWKSFGAQSKGDEEFDSLASRDVAYYVNNLVMVVAAVLLAGLTLTPAITAWLPSGGIVLSAGNYNAIARPLGILYLFLLAVCPLLSWGKTDGKEFWKRARVPGVCALVLFALLMVYFFTYLLPSYDAILAAGGKAADSLLEQGPSLYYNGLTVVGFFVASLLFFNSLFLLGRGIGRYAKSKKTNVFAAAFKLLRDQASTYGGFIAHLAMSIILVGLIGSSMYVTEKAQYMGYDETNDTGTSDLFIQDFVLKYESNSIDVQDNGIDILYTVTLGVYRDGDYKGSVSPSIQLVTTTQQQNLIASVMSFPDEDLFVVYKGVNNAGAFSLDVKINPLINLVWIGFALLMVGILVSLLGHRKPKHKELKSNTPDGEDTLSTLEALEGKRSDTTDKPKVNTPGMDAGDSTDKLKVNTPGQSDDERTDQPKANMPGSAGDDATDKPKGNTPGSAEESEKSKPKVNTPGSAEDEKEDADKLSSIADKA